jgi:ATP sulfurylase
MERAVELEEKFLFGRGHTALGAYHARSTMAELDESKKHFDKAIEISGGKSLMAKVQFAAKYYCAKGDKDTYVKLLNEVVEAGDVLPEGRLTNVIAKRKAKRYLTPLRMKNCGF